MQLPTNGMLGDVVMGNSIKQNGNEMQTDQIDENGAKYEYSVWHVPL